MCLIWSGVGLCLFWRSVLGRLSGKSQAGALAELVNGIFCDRAFKGSILSGTQYSGAPHSALEARRLTVPGEHEGFCGGQDSKLCSATWAGQSSLEKVNFIRTQMPACVFEQGCS